MNLRHLRHWQYFLRIAEAGSLSRVADHLGVAQPALSRHMRMLEDELGVQLLRRHGRGVQLTPAGVMFRHRAEALLRQIDGMAVELKTAADQPSGPLAVGMPFSMEGMVTAQVVERFHRSYPAVQLYVRGGTGAQLRDALLAHDIDLGVVATPLAEPQLETEPLATEPLCIAGPKSAGLNPRKPLSLKQVGTYPLLLTRRENSLRVLISNALESVGGTLNTVIESDAMGVEFARRGLGYCIAPSCALGTPELARGLSYTRVRGLDVSWSVARLRGRPQSLAADKFIEVLSEEMGRLIASGTWKMAKLLN